ncbi:DUF4184 family protein [Methanolobus sp. WCC5]|uniref:DUF4184 family protein n=1 Tax=Methanolobus sp. WCC5 TaxID=3125785 RepID=UPI003245735A
MRKVPTARSPDTMPFTPLHLGPAFLLGELFERRMNLIAILLGSMIIDLRATYCLFSGCRPLHGPLHTFIGATVIALLLAWLVFSQRQWLQKTTDKMRIEQTYSLVTVIAGSVIGTWSHVLFDSFIYTDIRPLWPLTINPFIGAVGTETIYMACMLSFVPAAGIYIQRYRKRTG